MKKVSMLVLLAIVASTLLMAAIPTTIVRLTVINKSGYDVYIKLEGSKVTDAFYYLTIPSGDRDVPTVKIFTVMSDLYTRTTWQCNGLQSSGALIVDGNLRLTFTPCGEFSCGRPGKYYWFPFCTNVNQFKAWLVDHPQGTWEEYVNTASTWIKYSFTHRRAGEPRFEKVTYFKYLAYGTPAWIDSYLYTGYWNFGCGTWYFRLRTYQLPYGCAWRYQY